MLRHRGTTTCWLIWLINMLRHRGTTTCWLINMLHRYKTTVYCHPGTPDAMAYTSIIYSPDTVRALRRALFTNAHIPSR